MAEGDNWKFHARKMLIEAAIDEIKINKPPHKVYLDTFYMIASFGLHLKAQKLGLLNKDEWQKQENHHTLITQIEAFLWKEIK